MHITTEDIYKLEKIKRANLINSITGIKPANLIGSRSDNSVSNLAVFSSVVHIGANPPLMGIIVRPTGEVPRHTYENILSTGYYTINHIPDHMTEQAHQTSAKYKRDQSEFDTCGFTEEYIENFAAPFVKESKIKIGLKYKQSISIPLNNTILCIGEIEHIILPKHSLTDKGYINLENLSATGISGLNSYYNVKYIDSYDYARVQK